MAELVADYFTAGWRDRTLSCPCGWQGDSRAMAMELHDAVTDYACSQCGNLLLIVSHPTLEQVRAATSSIDGSVARTIIEQERADRS